MWVGDALVRVYESERRCAARKLFHHATLGGTGHPSDLARGIGNFRCVWPLICVAPGYFEYGSCFSCCREPSLKPREVPEPDTVRAAFGHGEDIWPPAGSEMNMMHTSALRAAPLSPSAPAAR